jgi:Flp pilus assembly protein TadG
MLSVGRAEIKLRIQPGGEKGQTLIFIMLAMPLFFSLMSLVVDGGNILVHKRNVQVASDAAALAMAQSIDLATSTCNAACRNQGRDYAKKNGVDVDSSWHKCNDADPANPTDTNCWAFPYVDKSGVSHPQQVEVRLTNHVTTFIAGVIGLYGANVSARAVGATSPVYGASTTPGTTIQGTTTISTIPGGIHTTTDPDILSGGSGVAFTMSRLCTAINYSGSGSGTAVLGAFATNGGVDFSGNKPKKMTWLGYNQAGCGNNPVRPPSGDPSQCLAVAWGDLTDSNNLCVRTLAPLRPPINWPVTPPPLPTPLAAGVPFNPATDYPSKCADAGTSIGANWASTHPPGIYCVSGANTSLQFSSNGVDLTNGAGYTFFALGGAKISTSGNSLKLKFYWPATGCNDPRPTTGRPQSYVCFGRTITNYDPETLFYATYASADGNCAVCLQGQSGDLTGDIFAPKPDVFPPGPTQTGGLVSVGGGALAAGQGFIESWNLKIAGNTGSYSGTGASIVIPGQTHTTTDPDTTTTVVIPGTTIAGTVLVTTSATTLALDE